MTKGYVIWINGPFGVGKTTTARALHHHFKDSLLFDPEQIGFLLRKILPTRLYTTESLDLTSVKGRLPASSTGSQAIAEGSEDCPSRGIPLDTCQIQRFSEDFQDLPLWRKLTKTTIEGLVREYQRPVIVPMTLVNPIYFNEIIQELRLSGIIVYHFTLMSTISTLRRRLLKRFWMPGNRWAFQQINRCFSSLQSSLFTTHIHTDGQSVAQVVEAILAFLAKETETSKL